MKSTDQERFTLESWKTIPTLLLVEAVSYHKSVRHIMTRKKSSSTYLMNLIEDKEMPSLCNLSLKNMSAAGKMPSL